MSTTVVGVLGGSFDPPHTGHVVLATLVLACAPVDRLLVVPVHAHALGKQARAGFAQRAEMCELAFGELRRATVDRIEQRLGGPSFTLRTLQALQQQMPDVALRLVLGTDLRTEVHRWHGFDAIARLAPPLWVARAGHDDERADVPIAPPAVSSTAVRERLERGLDTTGLLPRAVRAYIEAHALYRSP
ncbi:MAG: nicotinate (nicotinamide) nucleotide adenylyltransferase [Myxococcota bacterium]|nr:nicotinate (nicotinamide) nucleotide adenylyltransferase [Myxococcota bacterium]MDW8360984.1 nicotinate (nicotinamide) nucleotide adenylyltransferase [Myxococcales bacterium]